MPYLDLADSELALGLNQEYAAKLRRSPLLHIIHQLPPHIGNRDDGLLVFLHLDEIEASGLVDCAINSVCHAGEELLHVRVVIDIQPAWTVDIKTGWMDMTDYNGSIVPMEVLEEMRMSEGISKADWRGRGISVGRTTWAVLTGWDEERERIHDEGNVSWLFLVGL